MFVLHKAQPSGHAGRGASMSLKSARGGLPRCVIGLKAHLREAIALTANDRLNLYVGEGDDAGKVRLVRAKDGAFKPRLVKGGVTINCGYVAALGKDDCEKAACDAQAIDCDTIEIVVPDWSTADAPKASPGECQPRPIAVLPGPPVVDLRAETISYRGVTKEVAKKVALLLDPLAKNFQGFVKKSDLARRVWGDVPVSDPNYHDLINRANAQLGNIGLAVRKGRDTGTAGCILVKVGA